MLDIGWPELLVVAIILIVVVGPKDLPQMLRAFGKMTTRLRKTAGEFRSQFDEALREAEMDDVAQTISDARKLNPMNSVREALNPLRQAGSEIKSDLQNAVKAEPVKGPVEEPKEEALKVDEPASKLPDGLPDLGSAATTEATPAKAARKPAAKKAARKPAATKEAGAKPVTPKTKAATSKAKAGEAKTASAKASPAAKPVAETKKTATAKKPAAPKKTTSRKTTAAKKSGEA